MRWIGRRWRSPFGNSASPACSTVVPMRVAVSTSCSARRPRECMCTSPGGDERQVEFAAEVLQLLEPPAVAARRQQFDRNPQLAGKERGKPACCVGVGLRWRAATGKAEGLGDRGQGLVRKRGVASDFRLSPDPHPLSPAAISAKSSAAQPVLPFRCGASSASDQPAETTVAATVPREQHAAQAVLEAKLRADDELEAVFAGSDVRPHDAGDRALVGDARARHTRAAPRARPVLPGCEAPRRKLKLERQCSSAYTAIAVEPDSVRRTRVEDRRVTRTSRAGTSARLRPSRAGCGTPTTGRPGALRAT